jgi:outer membrane protein TolC
MRWMTMVVGLALGLALVAGCKQQCFLHECDYNHYHELGLGLPADLECSSSSPAALAQSIIPKPATVLDPERDIRYMSLAEAISIALENGTVNGFQPPGPGRPPTVSDVLVSFTGAGIAGATDAIRVLALDPGLVGANIERSLSKFDARWVSSMTWQGQDQPIGNAQQGIQALGNPQLQAITSETAAFSTAIVKPLPTGGVANITFTNNYDFTNSPLSRVNPSYEPTLQFQFEQPLLQGFGVEINQIRGAHPGGILPGDQITSTSAVEGILITRIRYDQSRAEFERQVATLLLNVEQAYWTLYGAYWQLYSNEQALRQAFEAWRISNARYLAGRLSIADFAQTRGQYELFRVQRIQSLDAVLEAERNLRGFLGLPMEDCKRLVPCDAPTLAPYHPDWCSALNEALALRPELVLAREELKFRQLDLINQKNQLLPDLRFISSYGITGLGSRLDGGSPNNALANLASDHFTNWQLGLNYTVPIGFRDAHAAVRIARLNLARQYLLLRDQEYRATRFLTQQYRAIFARYEIIGAQRAQREAYGVQLRARIEEFLAGRGTLDILLEAQRFWAQALAQEYQAIVDYNNALAGFEYAKGTMLKHDSVFIEDGPLPQCAAVRAVAHQQERTKALVLLERAVPVPHAEGAADGGKLVLPELPADTAPSLPALMEKAPKPSGDLPEKLPSPKTLPPAGAPGDTGADKPSASLGNGLDVGPLTSDPAATPAPAVTAGKPVALPTVMPAGPATMASPVPLQRVPYAQVPSPQWRPEQSMPAAPATQP